MTRGRDVLMAMIIMVRDDLSLLLTIDFKATLTFSLNNGENLNDTDISLKKMICKNRNLFVIGINLRRNST